MEKNSFVAPVKTTTGCGSVRSISASGRQKWKEHGDPPLGVSPTLLLTLLQL